MGLAVALVAAAGASAGGADPVVDRVSGGAFGAFFEIAIGGTLEQIDAATIQTVGVAVNGEAQALSASDVGAQQIESSRRRSVSVST